MIPKKTKSSAEDYDSTEVKKADDTEENGEDNMTVSPSKIFQDGVGLLESFKGYFFTSVSYHQKLILRSQSKYR